MSLAEKVKGLTGYNRIVVKCDKCNSKIIFETDYLTETQAKQQHKCKGGNNAKSKSGI